MSPTTISLITMALSLVLITGFFLWTKRYLVIEGYHRVTFIREDKNIFRILIKLDKTADSFSIGKGKNRVKYSVDKDTILHAGRLRLPAMFYIDGQRAPIDMLGGKIKGDKSALDYQTVAENSVVTQLLQAFMPPFISPTTLLFLLSVVILLSSGAVYFGITKKLDDFQIKPITADVSTVPGQTPIQ